MTTKICSKCREEKDISFFNTKKYKSGKIGLRSYCKKCHNKCSIKWRREHPEKTNLWDRNKRYKKTYGINEAKYLEMLASQEEKCAICDRNATSFSNRLSVDHNHDSNKIRGLLCVSCNTGIGSLKTIKNLRKAIEYYKSHGESDGE